MSGILGIVRFDGQPGPEGAPARAVQAMADAMAPWGRDGCGVWRDGSAGLGQLRLFNTPEARYERLPARMSASGLVLLDAAETADAGFVITAQARLDNRGELCSSLDIPELERGLLPDGEIMGRAYARWGEACVERLLGDWSFAAWHPAQRTLFVARDQHGITALFYSSLLAPGGARFFAFASSIHAIRSLDAALGVAPRPLDEIRLAQILTAWPGDGTRTMHQGIAALPAAHCLRVTPQGVGPEGDAPKVERRQYWRLEETPMLRLPSSQAYAEGLRAVLDQAVRDRLRSLRPIGVTLSGGLDSGSVTTLAARGLAERGERLTSFTSVPQFAPLRSARVFGDERSFASITAAAGSPLGPAIDAQFLDCAHISPLEGVRRGLAAYGSPGHAAANAYWLSAVMQECERRGIATLLTGQGGNAGISWAGMPSGSPLALLRLGRRREALRTLIRWSPLGPLAARMERRRLRQAVTSGAWMRHSAIHPDFARRIDVVGLMAAENHDPTYSARFEDSRAARYQIIRPGADVAGPLWAVHGAAHGVEVRDPTSDIRVLSYCLSVPEAEYTGPRGEGRYLLRRAMAGILPDAVLWNKRRGLQSADLLPRLAAHAEEMDAALARVEAAPSAREYVDVARMRAIWGKIKAGNEETATWGEAGSVLMRGLMAGLFVADFAN